MSIDVTFKNLRKEYEKGKLLEKDVDANPYKQFESWYQEILKITNFEANAMSLATTNKELEPNVRIVLLKGFKVDEGFIFYTNYESQKGIEINENPKCATLFYWPEMERQVRVKGVVSKISEADSDTYFNSRPELARAAAIASPQSKSISRENLEDNFKKVDKKDLKRPANWGGYILKANYFEFWQGRKSRMHDRLVYELNKNSWKIKRISP